MTTEYERDWDAICDEFCTYIDAFSEAVLIPGTPIHKFQNEMILHVKKYRESKNKEMEK